MKESEYIIDFEEVYFNFAKKVKQIFDENAKKYHLQSNQIQINSKIENQIKDHFFELTKKLAKKNINYHKLSDNTFKKAMNQVDMRDGVIHQTNEKLRKILDYIQNLKNDHYNKINKMKKEIEQLRDKINVLTQQKKFENPISG